MRDDGTEALAQARGIVPPRRPVRLFSQLQTVWAAKNRHNRGISPDDFARMLARQNGRCASCKIRPAETLCVDHCHRTGMVRGLLCRKCNTGLGCFNDSPALMLKAMAYLYRHAAREIGAQLAGWRAFISHLWQVRR